MTLFERSFLITTGITAVICGAIFYYFNSRMRELELALAKQSQVLSSFIANVQHEFRLNSTRAANTGSLASAEATKFVESMEIDKNKALSKIVISDSDSDDESVSDDESDSDDESVNDDDASVSNDDGSVVENSNSKLVICDLTQSKIYSEGKDKTYGDDIKVIELTVQDKKLISEVYTPEKISDDEDDSEDDDDESDIDTEYEHIPDNLKINIEDVSIKTLDISEVHIDSQDLDETQLQVLLANVISDAKTIDATASSDVKSSSDVKMNDLKVDDMRKLALDKGLTTKEEVKKLKKNELLALLKK